MAQNNSIESLYKRYLDNDLNEEELADFLGRLHNAEDEANVSRLMEGTWKEMYETSEQAPVIPIRRRPWIKYIAAASLIVGVLATAVYVISKRSEKSPATEIATTHDVPAPTNTRAVITLADGSKVYLDSAGNGTIAQQNDIAVVKDANGGIKYLSPAGGGELSESPNNKRPGVDYNVLFNPRGSKVISLTLSDGTKVWLNSESSLRYPASFSASSALNREVEITGEAYFEVVHNTKQPFKVHLPNGSIVEDIGTSFNINAYPDEEATKTTLIEGAVKISAPSADKNLRHQREKILKPGEQARLTANSQWLTTNPDLGEVMAWKNGLFQFNHASLNDVMRQIARWYDVDVVYQGKIEAMEFGGKISRTSNLSEVLKILQLSKVNYKIEGNRVIIMP